MWTKYPLKGSISLLVIWLCFLNCGAQYYYKDIIITQEIGANYRLLKANKVTEVKIFPYEINGPIKEGVTLGQTIDPSLNLIVTYTKAPDNGESWLKSYYSDKGFLAKTVDSSTDVVSSSSYEFDKSDRLIKISSNSVTRDRFSETETHWWTYNSNGTPEKMIKIKNGSDTTLVTFVPDDQGNIGEEKATRHDAILGITYYYYDGQHRLTDVARYNKKADRILPEYMFEYNPSGQIAQMILVPEGSSDYQIWMYAYNQQGLKSQEICYNKQKQPMGKIEYSYSFNWEKN